MSQAHTDLPVSAKATPHLLQALSPQACHAARMARDARFDGAFYTAVVTTGIYCRPICPARAPAEHNVRYFNSAAAAAQQGFRPCLRCKPDGAPGLAPSHALVAQALRAQAQDSLDPTNWQQIADQLGITDRYLRQCFVAELGVAPKQYQLYQQCLLAKKLLHETKMPVTAIAFASGFQSLRRFNDCFRKLMQLTPTQVRAQHQAVGKVETHTTSITLRLNYRPPYNWQWVCAFLQNRAIEGLELATAERYGRSFQLGDTQVRFIAEHKSTHHCFEVTLALSDWRQLRAAILCIRRILDLDAPAHAVDTAISAALAGRQINAGLRLLQFPSVFEAGVRAVLGQQVSVKAARNLVAQVVAELGDHWRGEQSSGVNSEQAAALDNIQRLFPSAAQVAASDLSFLKMPSSRRETLRRLAQWLVDQPPQAGASAAQLTNWLALKGIGPWTCDYARMRGAGDTNIWLIGDLGVKQSLQKLSADGGAAIEPELAAPWQSYLSLQMWSQL